MAFVRSAETFQRLALSIPGHILHLKCLEFRLAVLMGKEACTRCRSGALLNFAAPC